MNNPIMKCGHAANAVHQPSGKQVCAACIGITADAEIIDENHIDLAERVAKCTYCKNTAPSSAPLPFFGSQPSLEHDSYYCGCRGWD